LADLNGRWEQFESNVFKATEQTLAYQSRGEIRKAWTTDEMTGMVDDRRKWKTVHSEAVRRRNVIE